MIIGFAIASRPRHLETLLKCVRNHGLISKDTSKIELKFAAEHAETVIAVLAFLKNHYANEYEQGGIDPEDQSYDFSGDE